MAAATMTFEQPPSSSTQIGLLPDITSKGIYEGQYQDRRPDIKAAGKLTATGDSADLCMTTEKRPATPDVVKKFQASLRPAAGRSRIFYGKANDPQLVWAANMMHGVGTHPSLMAGTLLNPWPNTRFQQAFLDKKESLYASHKSPLGRSHDNQSHGLPSNLDPVTFTFGIQTEKGGSAGELVNPNKSRKQVNEEYEQGRDLYRQTHFNFHVGEQCNRKYLHPSFNIANKFGTPTPHENDGRHVRKTLKWLHDTRAENTAPIVSQRVDAFRDRTQPQLGKVHDPIKDTLNVPPDHTFGILVKPDQYGAGDLLHWRNAGQFLRGKDRVRGIVAALRQHIKKANYHNFQDLLSAFKYYDKDKSGKINMDELREVCIRFNLPAEPELLEQLFLVCDTDGDGLINYTEFANFLNWRDKLPAKILPHSAPVPGKLEKQIDTAVGRHFTSASMINAVVGSDGISTRDYRKYGVPTIRTDLPAPRIRRIDDTKNYGDDSDGYGLINPSIYSTYGVYEKDFLMPRPKSELYEIFRNTGVQMTLDTFDDLYQMAADQHAKGHVSVESLRNVLDQAQATNLIVRDIV